jgi:hypothetical protein
MTRRFLGLFVLAASVLFAAQIPLRAAADLVRSSVLEGSVAYLRVGDVGKNLTQEIQSAQTSLTATNKIAGFVLDLRFADGTDLQSAGTSAELLARQKLPLAILVNGGTRGAAIELAKDLRAAKAGLIFGISTEIKPDIAVSSAGGDEKKFLENPYAVAVSVDTNSPPATNNLPVYVDHTSEADLVRARIKDGDEGAPVMAARPAEPPAPVIRDPVLARAVDLIKGLAIVRPAKNQNG